MFGLHLFTFERCLPQKRQLASQSLAFNIKDKVFCELFPDVVDVSITQTQTQCFAQVLTVTLLMT